MTRAKPGIIFMGTPDFAVPSLDILVRSDYPVKAVVTAVDKPSGRGRKIRQPSVKTAAINYGIPVLQPQNLKDEHFVEQLCAYSADLFIVVAFRMLPEKVWSLPGLGTVNLHASLLPLYRGAAPINHAIINGEKVTGVTTFLIEKEIDTGKILLQEKTIIGEKDTAGILHDRLMISGAKLLLRTVEGLSEGVLTPLPQEELTRDTPLPVAPKLTRDFCKISWTLPSDKVYDFIRGLSPVPGAWTILRSGSRDIKVKIYEADKSDASAYTSPGSIRVTGDELAVDTGDGSLLIRRIQAEGRKSMHASEFLRGFHPEPGAYCF